MQQVRELNTDSVKRVKIIGRPRVGSFGLFAVCLMLLCLQTHGQTEESPSTLVDGQEIFMEKSVPTKRGHTEHLFIRYSQQLYVEAIGEGAIIIKAYRSSATELELDGTPKQILIRDFTVYTYGSTICWIWNVNPVDVNALEIVTVKISIDGPPRASIAPIQAKLARSSLVALPPGNRVNLNFQTVDAVDFQVKLSLSDFSIPQKNAKIQFYAMRNMETQLAANSFLRMYVRKGTEIATKENTLNKASNTVGSGTIATLIPSDPDFCWSPDCVFSVHLDVEGIRFVNFLAVVFDRKIFMPFSESLGFLDQIRENDSAIYELSTPPQFAPSPDQEYVWRFSLSPIEGDADFSINLDTLPASYDGYYLHSNLNSAEDIILNSKQLSELNKTGTKFFVYVNATKQSTYVMRVRRVGVNDVPLLYPEQPVTSELVKGQINNYKMDLPVMVPETFRLSVRIRVLSGNPNLYVKECLSSEPTCMVTQEDIQQADKLSQNKSRFFRYSDKFVGDDSLELAFNCIPDTDQFKSFSFASDPGASSLYTSRGCNITVAVVGGETFETQLSRYRLELRGSGALNPITVAENRELKVDKFQESCFVLDVPLESVLAVDKAAGPEKKFYLRFSFLIISGDCDIYLSRTNPKPSQKNHDRKVTVDNVSDQLYASDKVSDFEETAQTLKGKYYVCIKARERILGSFTTYIQSTPFKQSLTRPVKELRWGQTLLERMEAKLDFKHLYYFNVDIAESQNMVQIVLQLTSIKGKFFYCVSNKEEQIASLNDCQWLPNPETLVLVILDSDPGFTRKGLYSVAVFPELPSGSSTSPADPDAPSADLYTYSLSLSSQSTFTEILEGVPYKLPQLKGVPRLLRLSVPQETLFVAVTSDDQKVQFEITVDPALLREEASDPDQKQKEAPTLLLSGQYTGAAFSSEKLKTWCKYQEDKYSPQGRYTQCYLYMKLWTSAPGRHEYTVQAFTKSSTNFLTEETVTMLPAPVKHKIILQNQPMSGTKGLYFNIFCESYRMRVLLIVRDLDDTPVSRKPAQTHTFIVNDLTTNVIYIDSAVLSLYKRPFISVEIENQDFTNNPTQFEGEEFDFKERIYVQISNGISRLTHMVPIEEPTARKGFMKYYKFTKRSDSVGMVYLQVNSGEVDLYATRSDKKVPSLNQYDFKSATVKGDELMLPVDDAKVRYNDNYIIGVYAREDSKYQILGSKNTDFLYIQLTPGEIATKEITSSKYLLFSFYNKNNQAFQIGVTGKTKGVSVTYRAYDELTNLDFLKEEPNPMTDPSHVTKLKDVVERITVTPAKNQANLNQYLLQIRSDVPTEVSVFVLFADTVLKVPDGLMLTETIQPSQCQLYEMFYLDQAYADQTITFDTLVGSTTLAVHGGHIKSQPDLQKQFSQPTSYKFKLADALIERNLTIAKLPVFREIFLQACNKAAVPSTILVSGTASNKKIVQLHAGERGTLSTDPNSGASLYYFRLDSTVRNFTVKFDLPESRKEGKVSDISSLDNFISIGSPVNQTSDWWRTDKDTYTVTTLSYTERKEATGNSLLVNRVYQAGSEDGYVLFAKKAVSQNLKTEVTFQLIVNDVRPISTKGQTYEHVPAGTTTHLELVKPPQSELKLTLSVCSGLMRITVTEIFENSDAPPSRKYFKLGDFIDVKDIKELPTSGSLTQAHLTLKGDSIYITASNLLQDKPSMMVVTPQVITGTDALTLSDFFKHYEFPVVGDSKQSIDTVTVESKANEFSVSVQPPFPSAGFEERGYQFAELSIEYTLFAGEFKLESEVAPSACPAQLADSGSAVDQMHVARTLGVTHKLKNGQYEKAPPPITISAVPFPKKLKAPFKALLQTKLTFKGPYSSADDDDAVVILKKEFTVPSGEDGFISSASGVGIFLLFLIFIAISAIVVWLCARRRSSPTSKPSQSTELGHVAVHDTASNSASSQDDSDGMRSPNITQPEDIALKSDSNPKVSGRGTGANLDDTL